MGFFRDLVRRLFGGSGPEPTGPVLPTSTPMPPSEPEVEAVAAPPIAAVEAEAEAPHRSKISQAELRAGAAERRRGRAEAVAHRRSTEILYLGRGVSKFLGDHQGDLAALQAAGMPALSTPAELAEALGLTVSKLRWLAFHAEAATRVHYVSFEVPKKSGGTRTLKTPHRTLALAQRWVFEKIVGALPVEPEAHGFVTGRSILTNAQVHAGRAVVVNLDLEDFFPSVGFRRVRAVFRRLGYSPSVATVLALLCTECPRRTVEYAGSTAASPAWPRSWAQVTPDMPMT
jgi:hypothetical protein